MWCGALLGVGVVCALFAAHPVRGSHFLRTISPRVSCVAIVVLYAHCCQLCCMATLMMPDNVMLPCHWHVVLCSFALALLLFPITLLCLIHSALP